MRHGQVWSSTGLHVNCPQPDSALAGKPERRIDRALEYFVGKLLLIDGARKLQRSDHQAIDRRGDPLPLLGRMVAYLRGDHRDDLRNLFRERVARLLRVTSDLRNQRGGRTAASRAVAMPRRQVIA